MPAWLRSALTTFLVTFVGLVPAAALIGGDTSWAASAGIASLLAAVRTIVAAVDPKNTSFGIGAPKDSDILPPIADDSDLQPYEDIENAEDDQ